VAGGAESELFPPQATATSNRIDETVTAREARMGAIPAHPTGHWFEIRPARADGTGPAKVRLHATWLTIRAVSQDARAVALVAAHCDIEERLALVPPSACVRGIYFKAIEKQVATLGVLDSYRGFFPADRFGSLSFHPISDYLVRLACAGALVASPEHIHDGMLIITKGNAKAFIESVLGRVMLRVLSGDPIRLMEQAMAGRRQSTNYGHWEMIRHSERALEITYRQEYMWIESAIAGAGLGTFEACGLNVKMENKLVDRFNGSSFYTW
jgi:uncharacterized protein (TIGR02265 family)